MTDAIKNFLEVYAVPTRSTALVKAGRLSATTVLSATDRRKVSLTDTETVSVCRE